MAWGLLGTPTDLVLPLLLPDVAGDAATLPVADMAAAALRHAPLVILLVLQLYTVGAGEADSPEQCSKALGFNESSGPKDRSNQDLRFCAEHHKRTCCEHNHTNQVLNSFAAFSRERSGRCAQLSRLVLCSACDGDVGVGLKSSHNLVKLCPSFCMRWFQSCLSDFFAPSGSGSGLQACGPGNLVCSPLSEITEDPTVFCSSFETFAVADTEEEPDSCYDGVPAATTRGKGPRAPWVRPKRGGRPWWRQLLDGQLPPLPHSVKMALQSYAPGIAIASAAAIFTWFLIRAAD